MKQRIKLPDRQIRRALYVLDEMEEVLRTEDPLDEEFLRGIEQKRRQLREMLS